ncbi:MAG: dolichyl-phosphate-mannose--protein mannosyltransferase [Aquificae bacterium]|nr:dolichyl-phosphate-mannose--protein mannosyltransferase [Aquificota bacterium]
MGKINRRELFALILILLAFLSMFVNLGVLEPVGDEPLRLTLAYEMYLRGDFFQPTRLGAYYFNKPPMFMWLTILSSKIVGWNVLTVRILSVFFTFFSSLAVIFFSYKVFKNSLLAFICGLSFITFGDILFFYGYLGEIDATFTFFIAVMMFLQYLGFTKENGSFIVMSGVVAGLAFLLKGFNAYGFFGLTFLGLSIYYREYFKLFSKPFIVSYILAVLIPAAWLIQTVSPVDYLKMMFFEVAMRAEGSKDFHKFFTHLISFPIQNIKQTLLTSLLVLFVLVRYKVQILKHPIKAFLLIILINYVPYLLFAGGKGMYTVDARYILPLLPFVAVVFGYILNKPQKDWIIRTFFVLSIISILLRFVYGLVVIPEKSKKYGSIEKISADIVSIIDKNQKIACSCNEFKAVCFFVERDLKKIVGFPFVYPDWKYLITCSDYKDGKLIKSYEYKGGLIELYERK